MGTSSNSNFDVVTGPDVWMEDDALVQLSRAAALPGCVRAVGMPDLHCGSGIPIGAALAFAGTIRPSLVGSDAGCGARLVAVPKAKLSGDALERRIRAEFPDTPHTSHSSELPLAPADPAALFRAVWRHGIAGLAGVTGVPAQLAELAAAEPRARTAEHDPGDPPDWIDATLVGRSLGTIGGGNHFAEISRITDIPAREPAAALGLVKGGLVVLVHSGSRGLGYELGARWGERVLEARSAEAATYLAELAGAVRYAEANRFVIAWRLLRALGEARPSKITGIVDVTHNTVTPEPLSTAPPGSRTERSGAEAGLPVSQPALPAPEPGEPAWIHRKGCAPAHRDQPTIVLGSRGAASWVMLGTGQADTLSSVAHGAGRRMTRSEARAKLGERYRRKELHRTATGGRVLCDRTELLLEEHPDAYKPIEPVIAALEARGMAHRVAALMPLFTIKHS